MIVHQRIKSFCFAMCQVFVSCTTQHSQLVKQSAREQATFFYLETAEMGSN